MDTDKQCVNKNQITYKKNKNKIDFFFTFKKQKINKIDKLWNWSPVLFLLHLLILQSFISPNTNMVLDNSTYTETLIELDNNSESVKNTTFVTID